ncbi:MAG: DUF2783 domain-containing protein [Gammaproteobacteria bacterium]
MTAKLRTSLGIKDPDDFYARLIDLHEGLTQEQSNAVNARIILLLANHTGDAAVLDEVLSYIKQNLDEIKAS